MGFFVQAQTSKPCAADFHVRTKALNTDSLITSLSKWQFATGVNAIAINLSTGTPYLMSSVGFGATKSVFKLKSDGVTVYKTLTYGGMILTGNTQLSPLWDLAQAKDDTSPPVYTDYGLMLMAGYGPFTAGPAYFISSKIWLLGLQATFTF